MTTERTVVLDRGTLVEVWCASNQHWSQGFRVLVADEHRVQVCRVSDGEPLPADFPVADIRPADSTHGRSAGW